MGQATRRSGVGDVWRRLVTVAETSETARRNRDQDAAAWDRLASDLRTVTEAGAHEAVRWRGRGKPAESDGAVAGVMRSVLETVEARCTVVCGEGEKDAVGHLARHESFGNGGNGRLDLDLAVDPIDGTTRLSMGLGGAISVLAASPRGTMFDPGPAYYMDKLVAAPAARGAVDPQAGTAERLRAIAGALGKEVAELDVFVLDKPRHLGLVQEIREVGARALVHPAGDIEGALRAMLPNHDVDVLMGTGGTPEGLIAASVARALGAVFYGRLDPQKPDEIERVREEGLSTTEWLSVSDLAASDRQIFAASGVTTGPLLRGVGVAGHGSVQTLLVTLHGGTVSRSVVDTA